MCGCVVCVGGGGGVCVRACVLAECVGVWCVGGEGGVWGGGGGGVCVRAGGRGGYLDIWPINAPSRQESIASLKLPGQSSLYAAN
jgi:hypothetical protein